MENFTCSILKLWNDKSLLVVLFLLGCNTSENKKPEHQLYSKLRTEIDLIFDTKGFKRNINYEPISLQFGGKSILYLGQDIEKLDSAFIFSRDANGANAYKLDVVTDYFSTDKQLSIELKEGTINGIFYFSADQIDHQIFTVSGSWVIDVFELTEEVQQEIYNEIITKLFPVLEGKLKIIENWKYEIDRQDYIEYFEIKAPQEGRSHWWYLTYGIEFKP